MEIISGILSEINRRRMSEIYLMIKSGDNQEIKSEIKKIAFIQT